MPGFPVPMLRPGGKARPRGGKDGNGGNAGNADRGTGHGSVESESWQIAQKRKEIMSKVNNELASVCFQLNTTIQLDANWVCFYQMGWRE